MRTARLRHEAGALAGLCCLVGLLDGARGKPLERPLAGVARAASLCQAYEAYRAMVSAPAIGFEHAVLLVNTLSRCSELCLGDCHGCGALLVVDSLALRPGACALCADEADGRLPDCKAGHRGACADRQGRVTGPRRPGTAN